MFETTDTVDELMKGLGGRLAQHRLSRRLTQEELAAKTGLSKRTVERLEKGESSPRLSAFVAVCQALGLVEGFQTLVPQVELGPLALAKGERLPLRIRKTARKGGMKWGDEV